MLAPLTPKLLSDLMTTLVEYNGISEWLKQLNPLTPVPEDTPWYAEEAFYQDGFKMRVNFDNPNPGPDQISKEIGLAELEQGLQVLHDKYPHHYADIIKDNYDTITCDLFMQCTLFGEEVYA